MLLDPLLLLLYLFLLLGSPLLLLLRHGYHLLLLRLDDSNLYLLLLYLLLLVTHPFLLIPKSLLFLAYDRSLHTLLVLVLGVRREGVRVVAFRGDHLRGLGVSLLVLGKVFEDVKHLPLDGFLFDLCKFHGFGFWT